MFDHENMTTAGPGVFTKVAQCGGWERLPALVWPLPCLTLGRSAVVSSKHSLATYQVTVVAGKARSTLAPIRVWAMIASAQTTAHLDSARRHLAFFCTPPLHT